MGHLVYDDDIEDDDGVSGIFDNLTAPARSMLASRTDARRSRARQMTARRGLHPADAIKRDLATTLEATGTYLLSLRRKLQGITARGGSVARAATLNLRHKIRVYEAVFEHTEAALSATVRTAYVRRV